MTDEPTRQWIRALFAEEPEEKPVTATPEQPISAPVIPGQELTPPPEPRYSPGQLFANKLFSAGTANEIL